VISEPTEKRAPPKTRGRPKTRIGIVTSNKMQKTVVVTVQRRTGHSKYGKIVNRREKFKAHVEDHNYPAHVTIQEGDKVRIAETPPRSRDKRWRIVEVLERGTRV
jgi:small subunit ribosomal protein S17